MLHSVEMHPQKYLDFNYGVQLWRYMDGGTGSAGARLHEVGGPKNILEGHMASAEREPIMGVWGRSPQRGPGAEPLVRGSGGRSPPEAESFSALGHEKEGANLHLLTLSKYWLLISHILPDLWTFRPLVVRPLDVSLDRSPLDDSPPGRFAL